MATRKEYLYFVLDQLSGLSDITYRKMMTVPAMNYIAVRGKGNPNDENGEYKTRIDGIDYTHKEDFSFISVIRLRVNTLEDIFVI